MLSMDEFKKQENRPALLVIGLFALVFLLTSVLYFDTLLSMVFIWERSDTYSHCFFIIPIFIYLIWHNRGVIQGSVKPSYIIALLLIPIGFVWLMAELVDVLVVKQLAFIAMVIVGTASVAGYKLTRQILFPLGFLFLAVPMGEQLIPVMIEFTADFTVNTLKLLNFPVYREGTNFSLPSGNWSVVEACSGIRYLIASITIGVLYAYITYTRFQKRALFILASIIVPIIANGLRAVMIVLIGHYSSMELATGVDHLVYGWLFFGVVVFLLFWIGSFWRDEAPAGVSSDVKARRFLYDPLNVRGLAKGCIAFIVLLLIWPVWNALIQKEDNQAHNIEYQLPVLSGWQQMAVSHADWVPHYVNTSASTFVQYKKDDEQPVHVYMAVYDSWAGNGELINSQNTQVDVEKNSWRIVDKNIKKIAVFKDQLAYNEIIVKGQIGGTNVPAGYRAWQWYVINGENVVNPLIAKLTELKYRIFGGRVVSASVVVYTPLLTSVNDNDRSITEFLDTNWQSIHSQLVESL